MKNAKHLISALLAAYFFLTCLAACGGNTPPEVTTEAPASDATITDAPDDGTVNIGGLKFTLEGGATYENGAISGLKTADSNTAFCEDIGETPICIDIKAKINGSTTGGMVLYCACAMERQPACMLFSKPIDSLAAAGSILASVWLDGVNMPVVDSLGDEFLDYVKDGMTITIKDGGVVCVE